MCVLSSSNLLTSNQLLFAEFRDLARSSFPQTPPSFDQSVLLALKASLPEASRRVCEFSMYFCCLSHLFPELMPHPQVHSLLRLFFVSYKAGIWISFHSFIWQILFVELIVCARHRCVISVYHMMNKTDIIPVHMELQKVNKCFCNWIKCLEGNNGGSLRRTKEQTY